MRALLDTRQVMACAPVTSVRVQTITHRRTARGGRMGGRMGGWMMEFGCMALLQYSPAILLPWLAVLYGFVTDDTTHCTAWFSCYRALQPAACAHADLQYVGLRNCQWLPACSITRLVRHYVRCL